MMMEGEYDQCPLPFWGGGLGAPRAEPAGDGGGRAQTHYHHNTPVMRGVTIDTWEARHRDMA